ncbi:MAG: putative lipid II flippase FtsW [Candidatus Portnoybacteria bacterium CG11_big_fil_rev_8_21_14_0_20_40_15]|uniref:Probable peptidoglycan glycosyltransferase FtsW n=1 Tax=Candidatus Portnoybacteria bacterium CG11_big_fil_rev_8_21_14_0_20_40_15 TaxID=1974817 RepID=A0A2H0KTQ0_9BACT|nr:MAG: putative lipid II flippase FtsW [Candidatus Portnoybacteria bacterium CG11_big_fil_rev_8_21_14_0_20_40_15]
MRLIGSKKTPNLIILTVVAILVIFGLFMVTSAEVVISQERFNQSFYFAKNQILKGLIPGLILGYIFFRVPYQYLRKYALPIFVIGLAMLTAVFIPGIGMALSGAKRWLQIGSFNFQPSEIFKLGFIIYLASFLGKTDKSDKKENRQRLIPFLIILGITGLLIALEPDIGTLGVFALTAFAMYFMAKTPLGHVLILGVAGILALVLLVNIFPHALERVQVLLHPDIEQGGKAYQINQSLIAFGSGGIFGQGLDQGKQKFLYLPQAASDSIAAVIGEELGFLGMLGMLTLFVTFGFQGLKIAKNAPDDFSRLLAGGITCYIIIQAFINITAIVGLIPLTGVTLPFISYGGTSLVVSLIAVGILLNISKYATK